MEWISFDKEKPPIGKKVLAWVECENCRNKISHAHLMADYGYNVNSVNMLIWYGDKWNVWQPNVTHWMHPPKGPGY